MVTEPHTQLTTGDHAILQAGTIQRTARPLHTDAGAENAFKRYLLS